MVGFDNARMLTDYAQKSSDVVHENGEKGKFCVQTSVGIIYIYIFFTIRISIMKIPLFLFFLTSVGYG